MYQPEVVHIQIGVAPTGEILLQFQHNDGSQYTTKMPREICSKIISRLEEAHGVSMQIQTAPPGDRIRIRENVNVRLSEE